MNAAPRHAAAYQLSFHPLPGTGRHLAFPCDASGRVDLDGLARRHLNDYLYARAVIGREFVAPMVEPAGVSIS